jgi:hypothetical protein
MRYRSFRARSGEEEVAHSAGVITARYLAACDATATTAGCDDRLLQL